MLMTAIQLNELNAQIQEYISLLSDSETLMRRLAKYVSKLVKEKEDPTLFTKEEFYARIDKSLEQSKQGKVHRIESKEELNKFLNSL